MIVVHGGTAGGTGGDLGTSRAGDGLVQPDFDELTKARSLPVEVVGMRD